MKPKEFEPTLEMLAFESWMLRTYAHMSLLRRKYEAGYFSGQVNQMWRGWNAKATQDNTTKGRDTNINEGK